MRNPIFKKNYLFVRDGCDYCRIAKKSVNKINLKLPITKQIQIIDCTYFDNYGIINNPIINQFKEKIEAYPTLFINGVKKEGANSVIQYTSWLKVKLFNNLLISIGNEYLHSIEKYEMFDFECKKKGGRIVCN